MNSELTALTRRIRASLRPSLTHPELAWLWPPLLRLLSRGEPITVTQLATAAARTDAEVRRAMATLSDTEYDAAGRIIGCGLTLRATGHRFTVDESELYTWCALDTLIFPSMLGRTARVESRCPATATPVRLIVTPDEITHLEPTTAVLSLVTPEHCTSVRAAFCEHVHFFASPEDASGKLAEHPASTVLPVPEAHTLARQLAHHPPTDEHPEHQC
ncbi:alkylmercury lyase [Actinopolyspora xinjiangensis]|uniref:Alkylmercury lyase n=1 Tax=Actinopolyspora xinjiangensis TaxID=405564 RepID=A0A1H0VDG1_9ACTN|nr:organomercurial lyase MerB [Actinopolyspora xinjiangensis]SDP76572.1 alkylmercury lyase [Actinopolyspora xinjiangensis]